MLRWNRIDSPAPANFTGDSTWGRTMIASKKVVRAWIACTMFASATASFVNGEESEFAGLIRTKTPDRSSYSPPAIASPKSRQIIVEEQAVPEVEEREVDEAEFTSAGPQIVRGQVRQVAHQTTQPVRQSRPVNQASYGTNVVYGDHLEPGCGIEPGCGMEPACGCDGGCDSYGACGGACGCGACGFDDCRVRLSVDPCQWFGSVELLMMWRVGDGLPPLATTSTTATGTGVLNAAGTEVLFGNERVLDEIAAGGRVTLGTWLDDQQCRSLVFRGWGAEQESFSFFTDEDRNAIIARPFFNVTDGRTPANDSQLIAAPTRFDGSLSVTGSNDVYGGDVSIRQRWFGGLGGIVDVLYGYQYMRMEDKLRIATSSTVLAGQTLPQGTILDVVDSFDAENEFHGGQLGLAARYREGCWSFNGTLKAAVGSLNRTAIRAGSTNRSSAGVNAPDPNGLLVRSTNDGSLSDSTFGWIPELDATIGWRWTRNLDLTFGYHVIAMTDALQVSGMIDPTLAVNAADNPTGQQRPSVALRYDTFYVHGIHFGLQCVY
jgi:hypothetical protein